MSVMPRKSQKHPRAQCGIPTSTKTMRYRCRKTCCARCCDNGKLNFTPVAVFLLLCLCVQTPLRGDFGDVVATISPERIPGQDYFCAFGAGFDGTNLYLSRCGYSTIDVISSLGNCPHAPATCPLAWSFDTHIPEGVGGLAFDATRNGLWIGTQAGREREPFNGCGSIGMPIYFWDFDDNSVTLVFDIQLGLVNPVTGERFFRDDNCNLDGLAYRENDPIRDDDDEVWISEERNRNIGVFRTNGTFVRGYSATSVSPGLFFCTGLALHRHELFLATGCFVGCGDVFRADALADPLVVIDQLVSAGSTPGNRWEADMACDNASFASLGKTVMWVRTSPQCSQGADPNCDGNRDVVTAYEIEPGGCEAGPQIGACCDPMAAPCRDVPQSQCQGPTEVSTDGVLCATLDPPCHEMHRIILLDRTGSMQAPFDESTTRCERARQTAIADVMSFFTQHPIESSVAVWTFAGTAPTQLTPGFVDEATAIAALESLAGVNCSGLTPLAESLCDAVDALLAAYPSALARTLEISVSTDGEENNSDGSCAGDRVLLPPFGGSPFGEACGEFHPDSWQQKVCDHTIDNAVVLARFWGNLSLARAAKKADTETGALLASSVPDDVFFQALAEATGGAFTFIDDFPPEPTGPSAFGVTGACCLPDATCQEAITEAECAVLNGLHQGDASVCVDATGACCLSQGTCQDAVLQATCEGQGGAFQGTCTACDAHVIGACCLPNETCEDGMALAECAAQNGTDWGGCTVCTGEPGECSAPAPIPAVSEWGVIVLTLLILVGGTIIVGQRGRVGAQP